MHLPQSNLRESACISGLKWGWAAAVLGETGLPCCGTLAQAAGYVVRGFSKHLHTESRPALTLGSSRSIILLLIILL